MRIYRLLVSGGRCSAMQTATISWIGNMMSLLYSFIVATHTDRAHIHNHIVFNSTAMDGTKKFRDFRRSGLALQKISDLICLENGLSVIAPAPYSERQKRTVYPKRESVRSIICSDIDTILAGRPKDFEAFVRALENAGYAVKRGGHLAVKGKTQQRFIRLSSLGEGYREEDIRALFTGERKHESKIAGKSTHIRITHPSNYIMASC